MKNSDTENGLHLLARLIAAEHRRTIKAQAAARAAAETAGSDLGPSLRAFCNTYFSSFTRAQLEALTARRPTARTRR